MKIIGSKCPYCNKTDFVPDVVYSNVKNYGTATHHVRCLHCSQIVKVFMKRVVLLMSKEKSDRKEADW